ncbi:MAG: hypothetical protein QXD89_01915 [Candidatus Aenigmatarchaeota archaeon]
MEENRKDEEFELIPITPLRRLEKKIEILEKKAGYSNTEIYRELISIVRMNQEMVDALIKANDSLRIELSKLPVRLEELTKKIEELLELIKAAGEEEEKSKTPIEVKTLIEKMEKLAEINNKILETNENLLTLIEQLSKKLSRPSSLPLPPKLPIQQK